MTIGDTLGISDSQERLLVRGMQLALAGLIVYGLATLRFVMAANGGLALGITLLPALLRREYDRSMDAGLVLWITVAVFLHTAGSLGLYARFRWYDEVAHTVSSTVIGAFGYASFRAFERYSDEVDVPSEFRGVFIVVFVLANGVIWEILEFASGGIASLLGVRAPLRVMGIDDIVTDMIFNTVGAVIVAVWGTGHVNDFVAFLGRRLEDRDG